MPDIKKDAIKNEATPSPDTLYLLSPYSLDTCKARLLAHDDPPGAPGAEGARVLTGPIDGKTHWFTIEHLRREGQAGTVDNLRVIATTKGSLQRTKINETLIKGEVRLPWQQTALVYGTGICGGLGLMVLCVFVGINASLAGIIAGGVGAAYIAFMEIKRLMPRRERLAQQVIAWLQADSS